MCLSHEEVSFTPFLLSGGLLEGEEIKKTIIRHANITLMLVASLGIYILIHKYIRITWQESLYQLGDKWRRRQANAALQARGRFYTHIF